MKILNITILDGWARKVGLVAVSASLIGWLIFVICFGSFNTGDNFYNDIRENRQVKVSVEALMESPVGLGLLSTVASGQGAGGADEVDVPLIIRGKNNTVLRELLSEQDIEEDFPKNRADSDFFTFYWFVAVYPIAALLTIAHLIFHGVPIIGFILSLAAHLLLTLSLVCGSGAFWAEGNRLFSADNNYRNEFNSAADPIEAVPEDWRTDPYWGSWLVGEWVGLLITGICVVIYYTISPFFTNNPKLFRKSEAYEMDSKGNA